MFRNDVRMSSGVLLVGWLVLASPVPSGGQPTGGAAPAQASADAETLTNAGPLIPFLEGTDVFFAAGKDTVFEADILPHLVVVQNYSGVLDIERQRALNLQGRARRFAWSVSGTTGVRLRMFDQVSRPVRTPSYMPRGNVQFIWVRNVSAFADAFDRAVNPARAAEVVSSAGPTQVSVWEGHVIAGHHSNGQDGCFYEDQTRTGEQCLTVGSIPAERRVNKRDGSFSTNFVRAGVNYRRNHLEDYWTRREWGGRLDVEYHPEAWMDEEIVNLYGRLRVDLTATTAVRDRGWCRKRLELSGGAKYIHGHPESVWPLAVTAQATCFPTQQGGWGFFARYYGGQDYYNLGLLENIQRLHVGATFNQSAFFRFRRPAPSAGATAR
jgi:hypothetical protein